ncbi:MAG TPA: S8 family serine peptidase [Nitrospiria bacterium]|nr:S8 family serine peptidase [Nitrospiria bacterium]
MVTYRYGGKTGRQYRLTVDEALVAVRTRSRRTVGSALQTTKARQALDELEEVERFRYAGVQVFRYREARGPAGRRATRQALKREPDTQFAGRVLVDPISGSPVLYTENLFVKFQDDVPASACRKLLKKYQLAIKRELEYARNAYFIGAPEGIGQAVFDRGLRLLREEKVDLCHPELVRRLQFRGAFPAQWHLKKATINGQVYDAHVEVEAAWALSQGEGAIIAVIDDGVDLDHEEFGSSSKIVAPRDVTRRIDNARPGSNDHHGTACAGVASANGLHGASGVAPKAQLMPIRLASGLGSQQEADAFVWAASHGADVISCSWGPPDGRWWDPSDPVHGEVVPLPDSTRLAIDWAVTNGRNGRGCVITWAAGNGNESVDNDGYASYEKVIAVAACNARGKKSAYSDFGTALWCAFPSNDFVNPPVPGIWTTDRSGVAGYNSGQTTRGDAAGNYVNDFGGTSSACPGVAGVAALVLARNPGLRWNDVKDILRRACDKIDPAGGQYDANGFSLKYGYGRINARQAVELAIPAEPDRVSIHTAVRQVPIRDFKTSQLSLLIAETAPIASVKVHVEIEHTYIGDLVVKLRTPAAMGVALVVLHNRAGGGTANLKTTFDSASTPELSALKDKNPQGRWTLLVQDNERLDLGKILRFSVELAF